MTSRKSQRKCKAVTIWKEKDVPSTTTDSKIPQKADRTTSKTVLQLIATGPLPKAVEIDLLCLSKLLEY